MIIYVTLIIIDAFSTVQSADDVYTPQGSTPTPGSSGSGSTAAYSAAAAFASFQSSLKMKKKVTFFWKMCTLLVIQYQDVLTLKRNV